MTAPQYPEPRPPNGVGRFLGAIDGAPPPTFGSPFIVGDFVIDYTTPTVWICTTPGNVGVWTNIVDGSTAP